MDRPIDTVHEKVQVIFAELVGERARQLNGSVIADAAMKAIGAALASQYGPTTAADVGFHMADWNFGRGVHGRIASFPGAFLPGGS